MGVISYQHQPSTEYTATMNSVLVFLALVACAVASHGHHRPYGRAHGYGHGSYGHGSHHGYGHLRYGRSAEPEPEADAEAEPGYSAHSVVVHHPTTYHRSYHYPSYSYSRGYPYSYRHAVHSLHKRSAEAEPEAAPEAEPGYVSRYHGYGHRSYGHHYPARSYSYGHLR